LRRFGRDRFLLIAQTRDLADPAGEPEAAVRARWDEAFGQLIDAVATEGLDGNTVIVLAGSHGDAARPMSDAALRVGLVIRGLPAPPTGRVRDIVRLADLGPALVDVAGGSPGFGWSGVSLLREYALRGPEDRVVLAEAQREDEALSAVRDGQWKWTRTESARGDRDAVYFLPADPDEAEDLTRTASGASSLDRRIAELRAIRDRACMPPRRPLSQDECATLRRLGYDDRADDRCRDVL
jgi:arylsulfatase A-like enzyme